PGTCPMSASAGDMLLIRTFEEAGIVNSRPFPFPIFTMTINEAEAIASAIISGGDIGIIRSDAVHLQVAVFKAPHVLVAEHPHVYWKRAVHIADFEILPVRWVIDRFCAEVAVHRNAADSAAIVRGDDIIGALVHHYVLYVDAEGV